MKVRADWKFLPLRPRTRDRAPDEVLCRINGPARARGSCLNLSPPSI
jgi:hypothetical protein